MSQTPTIFPGDGHVAAHRNTLLNILFSDAKVEHVIYDEGMGTDTTWTLNDGRVAIRKDPAGRVTRTRRSGELIEHGSIVMAVIAEAKTWPELASADQETLKMIIAARMGRIAQNPIIADHTGERAAERNAEQTAAALAAGVSPAGLALGLE